MPTQTLVKKISGKTVPILKSRISTKHFKLIKDEPEENSSNDTQYKRKQSVWQGESQNPFVDKDQYEEISQILGCNDPQLPNNWVEFSYSERMFVPVQFPDQRITLIDIEGNYLHVDSPEAKEQIQGPSAAPTDEILSIESKEIEPVPVNELGEEDTGEEEVDEEETKESKEEEKDEDVKLEVSANKGKKLMNQFNFCERATITNNNSLREAATQTKPPTRATFSDHATQWIIYDSYLEDYEQQEKERDKAKREKGQGIAKKEEKKKVTSDKNELLNSIITKKALILERMINQNMFDDILQDFRYYEDPSDEFRNNEGTLLPLWKFQCNELKKLSVTDIKWNPHYFDLFAVSFGSFDFHKQTSKGCFCLWSLKNPSYPEYINLTENGIMTLDFHHSRPYLVAVGSSDGCVAVYDVRSVSKSPIYCSSDVKNKHNSIVWQVLWGDDLAEGESTFYSISSDGNVYNWVLMQNHLSQTLVISLNLETSYISSPNGERKSLKGSASCVVFHPTDKSLFLIGTEEGFIYKCSTAYRSTFLFVYEAHHMPVHKLDYNKFSSNIFVSCSSDWCIKVWENCRSEPLFVFDVASAVGDVKWAPYSSTVLAAVGSDCRAYVFDLNVDKYRPICVQAVAPKKQYKLTRVSFNWRLPIIIMGDNKGDTLAFKLSPNLRIKPKVPKKQQTLDPKDLEIMKLEKLLSLIREPTELSKIMIQPTVDSSSM